MRVDDSWTLREMKDYIRKNKLNKKPHLRLGMNRDQLIAGFKKEGKWYDNPVFKNFSDPKYHQKPPVKKAPAPKKPKLPPRPKAMAKLKKAQVEKSKPKRAKAGTTTAELQDLPMDISKMIGKSVKENYMLGATRSFPKFEDLMWKHEPFMEELSYREDNVIEGFSWGSEFYRLVKKITKRDVDHYDDLTDSQKEKFFLLSQTTGKREHRKYIREIWNKHIKGKKFASTNVLIEKFMEKYLSTY